MKTAILLLAALPLLPAAAPPMTAQANTITYETGPCFGFCPIYRVTVSPDGSGLYEGIRHVAVRGQRRFRISPAQYRAFARNLEPVRPARGSVRYVSGPLCGPMVTDMPSVDVTWRRGPARQSVHFYYGCRRQQAIAERLQRAPALLPVIAPWIASPAVNDPRG